MMKSGRAESESVRSYHRNLSRLRQACMGRTQALS